MAETGLAGTGVVVEQLYISLQDMLERASIVEKLGVSSVWLVQLPNQRDTTTIAAGLAAATEAVTIGTGIIPVYSRPPVALAHAAMTLDEYCGNRFVLGVGLGHRLVGEWMVGVPAGPPVESMREYLSIVTALVRTGEVEFSGKWFSGHAAYSAPRRANLPILLGTFGPRMLQLAGEFADGAILWMCGPDYIKEHVLPNVRLGRARRGLGMDGFDLVYIMPAAASAGEIDGRAEICRYLGSYLRVPTYRRLFEASGFGECVRTGQPSTDLADAVGASGGESDIRRRIAEFHEAGITQVAVSPVMGAHVDRGRFMDTVAAAA